ncbi:MAG: DNA polymerase I [Paracoccaceae bacterium]
MSSKSQNPKNNIYLIDGSGFIFRAYYALPALTRSDGLPVGAISGFCNMIYKLLTSKSNDAILSPTHVAVIFDHKGPTFRSKIYPNYKMNRTEPPIDLIPQFELIREATKAFGLACIEMEGYEADDIIATYAKLALERNWEATIISSDKDLMQLVSKNIIMWDTMKNKKIGEEEVFEKFGVYPSLVIDVQALAGDSIDNIPGASGIGIKTASLLINQFGSLNTLLEKANEIKQPKRREVLINERDKILISKNLVTLKKDVPLKENLENLNITSFNPISLLSFTKKMEFRTLSERIKKDYEILDEIPKTKEENLQINEEDFIDQKNVIEFDNYDSYSDNLMSNFGNYETIDTKEKLEDWLEKIYNIYYFAIDLETSSLDDVDANLVGISLALEKGIACYIPVGHISGVNDTEKDIQNIKDQLPLNYVIDKLRPILEDPSILKIGQNIKFDYKILLKYSVTLCSFEDTMLMSYSLNAGLHRHNLDSLSERFLNHNPLKIESLIGTGKNKKIFSEIPIELATKYAAEDADITFRLWKIFRPMLSEKRVSTIYNYIEINLISVLAQIEMNGIRIDANILSNLSTLFSNKLNLLQEKIYKLSKEEFNIGSPKQLGIMLFEKLGFEGGKKGKNGTYSTDVDVLETLASRGHNLPEYVLEWRQLSKLRSTYTESLQNHIKSKTGRVHTSFLSSGATTGRLSSSNPNLQNIPIRTDDGKTIRSAFIADKGKKLVSFDYSQIELRVLAHIAQIKNLINAFKDGQDIHSQTASEVFQVPIEDLNSELRRQAKAINFGIIYGISPFGLANNLRIPREKAKNFIDKYFERYPEIKNYMDQTINKAKEKGYVQTLFGRKIHTPNINSKGPAAGFAKRSAINAPIQGTAADIIKLAMIKIPELIIDNNLSAKMVLQVHDELLFEVPDEEIETLKNKVISQMENASQPFLTLDVPLKVEFGVGENWNSAH